MEFRKRTKVDLFVFSNNMSLSIRVSQEKFLAKSLQEICYNEWSRNQMLKEDL